MKNCFKSEINVDNDSVNCYERIATRYSSETFRKEIIEVEMKRKYLFSFKYPPS